MSNVLNLDLQDLQNLLSQATRDNSKAILQASIEALQLQIAASAAIPASTSKPTDTEEEVKFAEYAFTSITDYGWENKDKGTIKIYLMKGLDGIKSLEKNKI